MGFPLKTLNFNNIQPGNNLPEKNEGCGKGDRHFFYLTFIVPFVNMAVLKTNSKEVGYEHHPKGQRHYV